MSATYAIPWTSTRDFVRFQTGDTVTASPIFQDEEYDGLLAARGGDGNLAAADALETLAGLYARQAVSWSVPGLSLNRTQTYKALLERAAALRKAALTVPWEFSSQLDIFYDTAGRDWSNYPATPVEGAWPWWP